MCQVLKSVTVITKWEASRNKEHDIQTVSFLAFQANYEGKTWRIWNELAKDIFYNYKPRSTSM